jgi:hypothetical protein
VVGDEAGRAAGALLRRGGEEAVVERVRADERLDVLARLDPAVVAEVLVLGGLLERVGSALAEREVEVPVRGGPCVLRAERDGGDARGLELVDVSVMPAAVKRSWL